MGYIIATSRPGYEKMVERLNSIEQQFTYISDKKDLTLERMREYQPKYIFFPHWSYIIPENIYNSFECIMFHMTDLPFGRGGSPLQNLIARGIYETKITAFKCEAGIDTGPVYMKRPFSLYGAAEEIYMRAAVVVEEMILDMINNHPIPTIQTGESCYFSRRRPEESNITHLDSLEKLFDYIRMLDAEGYPHAFLESEHFRFEFERASLKPDCIEANVVISKKRKQ